MKGMKNIESGVNTGKTVREIKRNVLRKYSTVEIIRIVIEGFHGKDSIAMLIGGKASPKTRILIGAGFHFLVRNDTQYWTIKKRPVFTRRLMWLETAPLYRTIYPA